MCYHFSVKSARFAYLFYNIMENNDVLPVLTFQTKNSEEDLKQCENPKIDCVKCEKSFTFPAGKDDYLAHLFLAHRLVIADVHQIALLEDYLRFWKHELQNHELEEFCTTMLLDQLPDGTPSKNEKYYLLSDVLPKDNELRTKLKADKLENALAQHQFELTDRSFSRECLYCRDVITGLRSSYLEHLFTKHFLQLGKPENLIYIDELINKVYYNLENLICLYCEKVFKDRVTLKEHMRKKAHKRINPNNKSYDKYFLQNYKFAEKYNNRRNLRQTRPVARERNQPSTSSQQETESVDFEQRFAQNNEDSDSDWSEWNGDGEQPLNCLYCSEHLNDFVTFKEHLSSEHAVNFDECLKGLNFYQKVKTINYVRRQVCLLKCVICDERFECNTLLLQHMQEKKHFGMGTQKQWDKPEYFFPTYEDDALLCILDDNPNDDTSGDNAVKIISEDPVAQINKEAERLSLENSNFL